LPIEHQLGGFQDVKLKTLFASIVIALAMLCAYWLGVAKGGRKEIEGTDAKPPGGEASAQRALDAEGLSPFDTHSDRVSRAEIRTGIVLRPLVNGGVISPDGASDRLSVAVQGPSGSEWMELAGFGEGFHLETGSTFQVQLRAFGALVGGRRYFCDGSLIVAEAGSLTDVELHPAGYAVYAHSPSGQAIESFVLLSADRIDEIDSSGLALAGLAAKEFEGLEEKAIGSQGVAYLDSWSDFGWLVVAADGFFPAYLQGYVPGESGRCRNVTLRPWTPVVLTASEPQDWYGCSVVATRSAGIPPDFRARLGVDNFSDGRLEFYPSRYVRQVGVQVAPGAPVGFSLAERNEVLVDRPFPLQGDVETFSLDALKGPTPPWGDVSVTIDGVPEGLDLSEYSLGLHRLLSAEERATPLDGDRTGSRLRSTALPGVFQWGPHKLSAGDWLLEVAHLGLAGTFRLEPGQNRKLRWSLSEGVAPVELIARCSESGELVAGARALQQASLFRPGAGAFSELELSSGFGGAAYGYLGGEQIFARGASLLAIDARGFMPYRQFVDIGPGLNILEVELEPLASVTLRTTCSLWQGSSPPDEAQVWFRTVGEGGERTAWISAVGKVTQSPEGPGECDFKFRVSESYFGCLIEWVGLEAYGDGVRVPLMIQLDADGAAVVTLR
jgi:hypothetical protein